MRLYRVRAQRPSTGKEWVVIGGLTRWWIVAFLRAFRWYLCCGDALSAVVIEEREFATVPCSSCGHSHRIEPFPENYVCPSCRGRKST